MCTICSVIPCDVILFQTIRHFNLFSYSFVYSPCTFFQPFFPFVFLLATVWAPLWLLPVSESGENCDHLQFSSRTNHISLSFTGKLSLSYIQLISIALVSQPHNKLAIFVPYESHLSLFHRLQASFDRPWPDQPTGKHPPILLPLMLIVSSSFILHCRLPPVYELCVQPAVSLPPAAFPQRSYTAGTLLNRFPQSKVQRSKPEIKRTRGFDHNVPLQIISTNLIAFFT